jgi:hypothetical protein
MSAGATAALGLVGALILLGVIGIGLWYVWFTHKDVPTDATQRQVLENPTQVLWPLAFAYIFVIIVECLLSSCVAFVSCLFVLENQLPFPLHLCLQLQYSSPKCMLTPKKLFES